MSKTNKEIIITFGCAIHDNWDEVWFTLQSIALHNDIADRMEILVTDNKPDTRCSRNVQSLLSQMEAKVAKVTYVTAGKPEGTSFPRDLIFRMASGKYVVCGDSHILLRANTLDRLVDWYERHPDFNGLVQGPMYMYDQKGIQTVFNDFWRGEMWGTWGNVWEYEGKRFTVLDREGFCEFVTPTMNPKVLDRRQFPFLPEKLPTHGHEQALLDMGFKWLGQDDDDEFDIPGQGLGLFSCRRDSWLGFNKHFRGFGGEEMYIHEKYRKAGRRTICLGFLKWPHKFKDPEDINYPVSVWNKVRNYVLGLQELGIPLDRLRNEFPSSRMPDHEWEYLLADPEGHAVLPGSLKIKHNRAQAERVFPLETMFEKLKNTPRDINEHMDYLRELASKCESVTEFSYRKESMVAFMAARPKKLVSYNLESAFIGDIEDYDKDHVFEPTDSSQVEYIEPTDLLFIDTKHTRSRVSDELNSFGLNTKRFIVLHDTVSFGQTGEDGQPGLLDAMKNFLDANKEWFIAYHTQKQHGLTVLGKLPEDRPENEIHIWAPGYGPGTQLSRVLKEVFGVTSSPTCDCRAMADQMDVWGVKGCRENYEELKSRIESSYQRWGWGEAISKTDNPDDHEGPTRTQGIGKSIFKAVFSGVAFKINPINPVPGLINYAIELEEKRLAEEAKTKQ